MWEKVMNIAIITACLIWILFAISILTNEFSWVALSLAIFWSIWGIISFVMSRKYKD